MRRATQDFNEWLRSHGYDDQPSPTVTPIAAAAAKEVHASESKSPAGFHNDSLLSTLAHSRSLKTISNDAAIFCETDENTSIGNNEVVDRSSELLASLDQTLQLTPYGGLELIPSSGDELHLLETDDGKFCIESPSRVVNIQRNVDLLRDKAELAVATRELEIKDFYLQRLRTQLNHMRVVRLLKAFLLWKNVSRHRVTVLQLEARDGLKRIRLLLLRSCFRRWRGKVAAIYSLKTITEKFARTRKREKVLGAFTQWRLLPRQNVSGLSNLRATFQSTIDAQLNENKHLAALLIATKLRLVYFRTVKPFFDWLRIWAQQTPLTADKSIMDASVLGVTFSGLRHRNMRNRKDAMARAFRMWHQSTTKGMHWELKGKCMALVLHKYHESQVSGQLRRAFAALRKACRIRTVLNQCALNNRLHALRGALVSWKRTVLTDTNNSRQRERLEKFLRRQYRSSVLVAFMQWRAYTSLKRNKVYSGLIFHLGRRKRVYLATAFNALSQHSRKKFRLLSIFTKLERYTSRRLKAAAWKRWKLQTQTLGRVRIACRILERKLDTTRLARSFRQLVYATSVSVQKDHLKNMLVGRAFYILIKCASRKKRLQDKLMWVVGQMVQRSHSDVQEAFNRWKRISIQDQMLSGLLKHVKKSTKSSLRAAFHTWQLAAQMKRVQNFAAKRCIRVFATSLRDQKLVAFHILAEHARRKDAAQKLLTLCNYHFARCSFMQFVRASRLHVIVLKRMYARKRARVRECFTSWHNVTRKSTIGEDSHSHGAAEVTVGKNEIHCLRAKSACFSSWKHRVVQGKFRRLALQGIILRWEHQKDSLLRACWSIWIKRVEDSQELEPGFCRLKMLLLSSKKATLRLAFTRWRTQGDMQSRRKIEALRQIQILHLLRKSKHCALRYSFSLWMGMTKRRITLLKFLHRIMQNLVNSRARSAFTQWSHQVKAQRHAALSVQAVAERSLLRRLKLAWTEWKMHYIRATLSERCVGALKHEFIQTNMLEESFKSWKALVLQSAYRKKRTWRLLRLMACRTVATAFRTWQYKHFNAKRDEMLLATVFVINLMKGKAQIKLRRAMVTWKGHIHRQRVLEKLLAKGFLKQRLRHWKLLLVHARRVEEGTTRLSRVLLLPSLVYKQQGFHKLKVWHLNRNAHVKAARFVFKRLFFWRASAGFRRWARFVDNSKQMENCLIKLAKRSLFSAFIKWKSAFRVQRTSRAMLRFQGFVIRKAMMLRRARLLHGWNRIFNQHARVGVLMVSLSKVSGNWHKMVLRRTLQKWRSHVATKHALSCLDTAIKRFCLSRSFRLWTTRTVVLHQRVCFITQWIMKNSVLHNLRTGFHRIKQVAFQRLHVTLGLTNLLHRLQQQRDYSLQYAFRQIQLRARARRELRLLGSRHAKEQLRAGFIKWGRAVNTSSAMALDTSSEKVCHIRVAFALWRRNAEFSASTRRLAGLFAGMVHDRIMRKRLRQALYKWRLASRLSKEMVNHLRRVLNGQRSRIMRRAFGELRTLSFQMQENQLNDIPPRNRACEALLQLQLVVNRKKVVRRAFRALQRWQHRGVKLEAICLRLNYLASVRPAWQRWRGIVELNSALRAVMLRSSVRQAFARWQLVSKVSARQLTVLNRQLSRMLQEKRESLRLAFRRLGRHYMLMCKRESAVRIFGFLAKETKQGFLTSAFGTWKNKTKHQRQIHSGVTRLQRLVMRNKYAVLRLALETLRWRSTALSSAVARVQIGVMNRMFAKWRLQYVRSKKLQRIGAIFQKNLVMPALQSLRAYAEDIALRETIVLRHFRKKRLVAHFKAWKSTAYLGSVNHRVSLVARCLEEIIPIWHKREAFRQLSKHATLHRTLALTQSCRRKQAIVVCFYRWKERHKLERFRHGVEKCLSSIRDHQRALYLYSVFVGWKGFTRSSLDKRRAIARIQARRTVGQKRDVLSRLRGYCASIQLKNNQLRLILRKDSARKDVMLQAVLAAWASKTKLRAQVHMALKRLNRSSATASLRHGFSSWLSWINRSMLRHRALRRMTTYFQKLHLRHGFLQIQSASAKHHLFQTQRAAGSRELRLALNIWSMQCKIHKKHDNELILRVRQDLALSSLFKAKRYERNRTVLRACWSHLRANAWNKQFLRTTARQRGIAEVLVEGKLSFRRLSCAFRAWASLSRGQKGRLFSNTAATLLIGCHDRERRKTLKAAFSSLKQYCTLAKLVKKLDYSLCETLVQKCIHQWLRHNEFCRNRVERSFHKWKHHHNNLRVEVYKKVAEQLSLKAAQTQRKDKEKMEVLENEHQQLLSHSTTLKETIAKDREELAAFSMKAKCLESELEQKEEEVRRLQQQAEQFQARIQEERDSLSLSQLRVVRAEKENVLMQHQVCILEKELAEVKDQETIQVDSPDLSTLRKGMEVDLDYLEASSPQSNEDEDDSTMRAYCEQIELRCFKALGQLREATSLLKQKDRLIARLREEIASNEH